jgi:hypothetical protein
MLRRASSLRDTRGHGDAYEIAAVTARSIARTESKTKAADQNEIHTF